MKENLKLASSNELQERIFGKKEHWRIKIQDKNGQTKFPKLKDKSANVEYTNYLTSDSLVRNLCASSNIVYPAIFLLKVIKFLP